jgi:hypothetical protein
VTRALALLIRFRHFGGWRNFWRSGRGSVIAMVGKALILCYLLTTGLGWVLGVWFALVIPRNDPIRVWLRSSVEEYGRLAPIPLLVFLVFAAVLAAFERPFRFDPAEVDFLQAGPFSRRQLLTYKIGAEFSGLVVLALLAAPLGTAVFPFLSCFMGILLIFVFVYFCQLVVSSLGMTLGLRGSKGPLRLAVSLAILFTIFALVWFSFGAIRDDPVALYRQAKHSMVWRLALAPLGWFFEVVMAKRVWPDLVQWTSLCLVIDGALLATVYALDARLERREDEADQSAIEAALATPVAARVRWSFPLSSLGGGVWPLAWRQAMSVIRRPDQIGFALFMHGILLFAFYTIVRSGKGLLFLPTLDGHLEVNPVGVRICALLAIMLTMLVASGLSFDFRSDMGRMDVLKALPIAPMASVAGQLFVPVLIASAMQWVLMVVIALALRSVPLGLWVATAFVPPVSIVLMAIENLPSFWFPLRHTPGSRPEPFELFGHVLLHPVVRMVGYAVAAGTTLLVASLAFFLFGERAAAAIFAAWLTLAATGAGLVALLAHTFDRFDVTQDTSA